MKTILPLSMLFLATMSTVGCHLPDFSAGRLSRPFTSETTANTDPFLDDQFQPNMSSPHSAVAPRTFAQNSSPIAPQFQEAEGRARVTAYVPPTPIAPIPPPVPDTDLRLTRPPVSFGQTVSQPSAQSIEPIKNRFELKPVKSSKVVNPFSSNIVQNASYEEPATTKADLKQTAATVQNPFESESMKKAHTSQTDDISFPLNHKKPVEETTELQWRPSGTSFDNLETTPSNSPFKQPTQR